MHLQLWVLFEMVAVTRQTKKGASLKEILRTIGDGGDAGFAQQQQLHLPQST